MEMPVMEKLDAPAAGLERPMLALEALPHFEDLLKTSLTPQADMLAAHHSDNFDFVRAIGYLEVTHAGIIKGDRSETDKQTALHSRIDAFVEMTDNEKMAGIYLDLAFPVPSQDGQASWGDILGYEADLRRQQIEAERQKQELDEVKYAEYAASLQPTRTARILSRVAFWRTSEEK